MVEPALSAIFFESGATILARLPPLSSSPQSAACHLRDSNNRCHGLLPREGLSFGYLKGESGGLRREGSWESVLDQQISHCTQYWVIIRFASECEDALTPALSQGGRGQRRRERQQAGKRKGAGQAPFDTLIG